MILLWDRFLSHTPSVAGPCKSISAPIGLSAADKLSHKRCMLLEANSSLKVDPKCMAESPCSQTVHIIMRLYEMIKSIMGLEELKQQWAHTAELNQSTNFPRFKDPALPQDSVTDVLRLLWNGQTLTWPEMRFVSPLKLLSFFETADMFICLTLHL